MIFALTLLIAAASGFISLSYEILWYRVISYASWGLPGAFGLLLAAYLFGEEFCQLALRLHPPGLIRGIPGRAHDLAERGVSLVDLDLRVLAKPVRIAGDVPQHRQFSQPTKQIVAHVRAASQIERP